VFSRLGSRQCPVDLKTAVLLRRTGDFIVTAALARQLRKGVTVLKPTKEGNTASKEVTNMKKQMMTMLRRVKGQSGQSLVEYALILALISVVAILVLRGIGVAANNKLSQVNTNLQ